MAGKRLVLPGLGMKIIPFVLRFVPRALVLPRLAVQGGVAATRRLVRLPCRYVTQTRSRPILL